MRYDLILRRAESGAEQYLGQAVSKTHAEEWAAKRLRQTDVHFGDSVAAHPVGEREPAFVIE